MFCVLFSTRASLFVDCVNVTNDTSLEVTLNSQVESILMHENI